MERLNSEPSSSIGCVLSLACCIGSFSIACGSLMAMDGTIHEQISFQRGIFITSISFVYFVSLTLTLNKYFLETTSGRKFQNKYKLLVSDVLDITNKLVSAIQAILSCIAGYMVCRSSCRISFLTASHYMSDTYAWFGTAYFIYDMWSMYKVFCQKIADKLILIKEMDKHNANNEQNKNNSELYDKINGNGKNIDRWTIDRNHMLQHEKMLNKLSKVPLETPNFLKFCISHPVMTFHHMFLVSLGLSAVVYLRGGYGDCIFGFVYLMELSTPFVSFRSILSIMGLKDSILYIVNGLTMLLLFFICRVAIGPYVLHLYANVVNLSLIQTVASLSPLCIIISIFLFFPQFYWFYLMLNGAIKVFFPNKNKKLQINTNNNAKNNKMHSNSGDNRKKKIFHINK